VVAAVNVVQASIGQVGKQMADEPNWTDVVSALGSFGTGLAAAILSWRAYSLEQRRLHHELFPGRKDLYERFEAVSMDILHSLHPKYASETPKIKKSDVKLISDISMQASTLYGKLVNRQLTEFYKKFYIIEFRGALSNEAAKNELGELYLARQIGMEMMKRELELKERSFSSIAEITLWRIFTIYSWLKKRFCRNSQ
jgi:hypothetical protein